MRVRAAVCESCSDGDFTENVVGVSTDPYGEDVILDGEPELVVTCDPYGVLSEMLDGAAEGGSGSVVVAGVDLETVASGADGDESKLEPDEQKEARATTADAASTKESGVCAQPQEEAPPANPAAVQAQKQAPPRPKQKVALSFVDVDGDDDADSGF